MPKGMVFSRRGMQSPVPELLVLNSCSFPGLFTPVSSSLASFCFLGGILLTCSSEGVKQL